MTQNTNIIRTVCAPSRTSVSKAVMRAIAPIVAVSLLAASAFDPLGLFVTGLAQTQQPLNPVGGQPGGPPITPKPGGPLTPVDTTYKVDAIEFLLVPDQFVEYKFNLKMGATMMFNWKATGPLDVDFHTVPEGKPISASETFMRGTASSRPGHLSRAVPRPSRLVLEEQRQGEREDPPQRVRVLHGSANVQRRPRRRTDGSEGPAAAGVLRVCVRRKAISRRSVISRPLIVTDIQSASETAPTALGTHEGRRPSSATATRRRTVAVKTSATARRHILKPKTGDLE